VADVYLFSKHKARCVCGSFNNALKHLPTICAPLITGLGPVVCFHIYGNETSVSTMYSPKIAIHFLRNPKKSWLYLVKKCLLHGCAQQTACYCLLVYFSWLCKFHTDVMHLHLAGKVSSRFCLRFSSVNSFRSLFHVPIGQLCGKDILQIV
jgi:hypothetical protein